MGPFTDNSVSFVRFRKLVGISISVTMIEVNSVSTGHELSRISGKARLATSLV